MFRLLNPAAAFLTTRYGEGLAAAAAAAASAAAAAATTAATAAAFC